MKTLTTILCIFALLIIQTSVQAELFKWKDARGKTQYGDTPPPNVNAKPVKLPKITIIDNYEDQWKPMNFDEPALGNSSARTKEKSRAGGYTKLQFLAPKANQAIRANDGDVSAMISLKPPLKKGHQIVFSIDGKAQAKGSSRTSNFSNLSRGGHTIGVKVIDNRGKTLKSSSISFNVLRFSKLGKAVSDKKQVAGLKQAKTFNEVVGSASK